MPVRERELLGFVNVPIFRDHDLCPVATDGIFPGSGFDFGVDFRGLAHAVPPCIYSISLSPTELSSRPLSAVPCPSVEKLCQGPSGDSTLSAEVRVQSGIIATP